MNVEPAGLRPPDPSDDDHLRSVERRVVRSLALMFVLLMVAAGPFIDVPFGPDGWIARLLVLSITVPLIMVALVRSILEPARLMESDRGQLRELYERARLDSLLDPLTGLGNHRAFQEELLRQVEDARRYETPLSLVLIDLDDLKRVNDDYGHAAGDARLAAMGRLLGGDFRRSDRAFRIGGDEFAVLLPHTTVEAAALSARRLLASALEGSTTGERVEPFSFSAGISSFPTPSTTGTRLLRNADAALYWSKRHGRTDVQVYDPSRHGQAGDERNTTELAEAVKKVAASRSLVPVFQPIFSLLTGEPIGHEALVRPSPDAGFPDATALFIAAEATGRTVEVDTACLEVIAAGAGTIPPGRYLAVNLSPRTLETDEFSAGLLASIFIERGISPSSLVVELTEREVVEDVARLRRNLDACRRLGMRIAADDVGAGNAGLRLLSEVSFDLMKVDLSLVQGGVLRESSFAVLRALRDLAERSSAKIVAEGIETGDQLEVVRELGMTAGQGYLLGRPESIPSIEAIDLDAVIAWDRARRAHAGREEVDPAASAAPEAAMAAAAVSAIAVDAVDEDLDLSA